jgi:hypothetical protein
MQLKELCNIIGLNREVINNVLNIDETYNHNNLSHIWKKLYSPDTWCEGVKELENHFNDDKNGMKILTCVLNCSLYTYNFIRKREYQKTFL